MGINVNWQVARHRKPIGLWLRASWDTNFLATSSAGRVDDYLFEVTQWCKLNECGVRMSYDMFKFKTRAQVTMFLLKWS